MSAPQVSVPDQEARKIADDLEKRAKSMLAGKATVKLEARRRQSGIVYYSVTIDEGKGSFTHESYEQRSSIKIGDDGKTDFDRWFAGFIKSIAGPRFSDESHEPAPIGARS